MALPDHYRCEQCGCRFVIDFAPRLMCATHGDGDCCHVGEYLLDADGRVIAACAGPDCITFATTEWSE